MLILLSRILRNEQKLIDAIITGDFVGHYYLLIGEKVSTYLVCFTLPEADNYCRELEKPR